MTQALKVRRDCKGRKGWSAPRVPPGRLVQRATKEIKAYKGCPGQRAIPERRGHKVWLAQQEQPARKATPVQQGRREFKASKVLAGSKARKGLKEFRGRRDLRT